MRKRVRILYSGAGHRWQYGACALHAGYLRLQAHTQNMQYLLLFHGNNVTFICSFPVWLQLITLYVNSKALAQPTVTPHSPPPHRWTRLCSCATLGLDQMKQVV
jgi:hypothetical protein